ncbi:D-alanyl-D-alanine carboxypeptidase family protein [Carboxydothermus pertinax]|uniref:serine-type D-Ala-D-Ala carboxypeptidase n=1 Tax=Carboxydothermus pertinax TaxID=870242 RepID=A0A1L8CTV9_9THEO|nr:D-alanyl-D-alanine carboxypeptidase family protein [Carboxydothermus pertinax]GAV22337.1 D-alanyl-D-alanine carboxypeptidase [Carboxydothermus pertinax]
MPKRLSILILILLCFGVTTQALSAPLEINAKAAILMEPYTGKVLYEKDIHKKLSIASVTKLMTLLLAIEAVEKGKVKLDEVVKASEEAASMGGSQLYMYAGEEFTFKELLMAVAVASANDACVAVAQTVAGSEQAFVEEMNQRAQELGMTNTHFVNSYGFDDPNHYSTCYDLAILLKEAIKHPLFLELSQIKEFTLRGGDTRRFNTNKLLWYYRGVDAGKTGWTENAGYCLASTAIKDGLRLIAVVLGCPVKKGHFTESIKMYNYGFAQFKAYPVLDENFTTKVKVVRGEKEQLLVGPGTPVLLVEEKGKKVTPRYELKLPEKINAPVKKGQVVGEAVVYDKQKIINRVPLKALESCPKARFDIAIGRFLKNLVTFE